MFEPVAQTDLEKGITSLGSCFAAAREAKGIPLDQAAHDTRIREQRLREIEHDDLSHFAHPSYARMFLSDYARYLDIPFDQISHLLPSPGAVGIEGYQYLQGDLEANAYRPLPRGRSNRRRLRSAVLGTLAMAACAVLAFQITLTVRKLDRVNGSSPSMAAMEPEPVQATSVAPAAPQIVDVADEEEGVLSVSEVVEVTSAPTQPSPLSPLFVGGTVDHGSAVR